MDHPRSPRLQNYSVRVWNRIPPDWKAFIEFKGLKTALFNIMSTLHHQWSFQGFTEWPVEPFWYEMFAWTACPVNDIQAIIIDKRPLKPTTYSYRSIGCALGVKRRPNLDEEPDIELLPTIWKFLRLVHTVTGVPWTRQLRSQLQEQFKNGFNSLHISRQLNILFLQVQLTTGTYENGVLNQWLGEFIIPLVRAIGLQTAAANRPAITVIQMFNNGFLEVELEDALGLHVFRPSFMDVAVLPITMQPHVSRFSNRSFQKYANEIRVPEYFKQREVFHQIYRIISSHYRAVSFTDAQI